MKRVETGDRRDGMMEWPRCDESAPANPIKANAGLLTDAAIEFIVDDDAEPGNLIPAMARLLIDLARRHREHDAGHRAAA